VKTIFAYYGNVGANEEWRRCMNKVGGKWLVGSYIATSRRTDNIS